MAIVPSFSLQRLHQRPHQPLKAKLDLQQAPQQVHLRKNQTVLQAPHPRLQRQQHVSSPASGILIVEEKYALMTSWGSNRMPLVKPVVPPDFHPMDALGAMTARMANAGPHHPRQDLRLNLQQNILLQSRPKSRPKGDYTEMRQYAG